MCVAGSSSPLNAPMASRYSGNYGYGLASAPSAIGDSERQWYIDNGFGDPYSTARGFRTDIAPMYPRNISPRDPAGTQATTQALFEKFPLFSSLAIAGKNGTDYYRGVDPTARYLYSQQQQQQANNVANASSYWASQTGQQYAPDRSARNTSGYGVTYTYAGDALGIPK